MVLVRFVTAATVALLAAAPALALDQSLYGINYDLRQGPDWDPNKCKNAATIAADLKVLKTISTNVRTYALSDCDVTPVLKAAKDVGMTVWLGVWVSADSSVYDSEVAALKKLIQAKLIDSNVVGFNVGSEAVYRKDITAEKAIEYLKDFKSVLSKNKITAPVAITDIVDVLTAYPDMVAAGDVVTANQFPFWEKIEASKAVAQFNTRIQPLLKLANGKEVIISETGWPSGGKNANASLASPDGAARYLNDFVVLAKEQKWKYYYFAGFDSPYKAEQSQEPETVEAYFGIFSTDGKMKKAYADLKITKSATSDTSSSSSTTAKSTTKGNSTSTSGTASSSSSASTSTTTGKTTTSSSTSSKASDSSSTTARGKTDSTGAGTVHAGASSSMGTDAVSKDKSSSNNNNNSGSANSNTNSQNAASSLATASVAACLAVVSAVFLSL